MEFINGRIVDRLGHSMADNGIFYISLADYANYYRSTVVCKVHDGFHYKSLPVDASQGRY